MNRVHVACRQVTRLLARRVPQSGGYRISTPLAMGFAAGLLLLAFLWVRGVAATTFLPIVTHLGPVIPGPTVPPGPSPTPEPVPSDAFGPVVLVESGATWKYWDGGAAPGPEWHLPTTFDDRAWPSGKATLGYGNGDEATVIGFGGDTGNKVITAYFRHLFTVEDPSTFKALDLYLLRDDGAVVYLNGHEVVRSNLPADPITPHTLASGAAAEGMFYHETLPPEWLVAGPNLLAVEVHQVAATSSDLAFALALTGSPQDLVRFAAIGDYGSDGVPEAEVAARVKNWRPDFVITTGDNNYPVGSAATIDANLFKHYGEFITGDPDTTRFFPSLGNHDWETAGAQPYLERLELPGNELYYDFVRGDVHFFALDSDRREPDGIAPASVQGQWLQRALGESTARWKVVYFHHPPYSSGRHGSNAAMQAWPFAGWGATVLLAGHDHTYERLVVDGLLQFVNGLGGRSRYECRTPLEYSRVCYQADYGAMLVEAAAGQMHFRFIARDGTLVDSCTLPGTCQ